MPVTSIDPTNGSVRKAYPTIEIGECIRILDKSREAQRGWRRSSVADRCSRFLKLAKLLRTGADQHAITITQEMGKPIGHSLEEIEQCAEICEYYAEHGVNFLADQPIKTDFASSVLTFKPLGVILGIMPWNYPYLQVFRSAVPAIIAGNGFALKPASTTPDCGLQIEALFQAAGFPLDLFRVLLTDSQSAAVAMVHPAIQGISFTGSTVAGRKVAAQAGTQTKKILMELGGSDPSIILDDADLAHAARACVSGKMINGGQHCISVQRVIVMRSILEQFETELVREMESISLGDPFKKGTRLGPLGQERQRDELHQQVIQSLDAGAQLLTGGKIPERPGFFYPPTVLTDVKPGMPFYDEEVFGPALGIIPVEDESEAVAVANDTIYGLGAALYTARPERATALAEELDTGMVFINDFVRPDPRLPFGGVKASGVGRELGRDGIQEFVNKRVVVVA